MDSKITIERRCEYCSKLFTTQTIVTRFCSGQCNSKFHKTKIRNEKIERSIRETYERTLHFKKNLLDREVMTVKGVAEILGSSKITIYRMINSGRLQATNLGTRMIRILSTDVLKLLGQTKLIPIPQKRNEAKVQNDSIALKDGYKIKEIIPAFGKSRDALYIYLKRNQVPRERVGKEIVLSKDAVDKLYRKFRTPKCVGLDKEIEANLKLSKKALKIGECYSIEECVVRFGKPKNLLYGIFNRRKVQRIREGRKIYVPKEIADKIFLNLRRVRIVSKVTLRQKAISKGRSALFLDIYPPVPHPETGILIRKYYLKMYVFAKPKTEIERHLNKETLMTAELIRARVQIEIHRHRFSFLTEK